MGYYSERIKGSNLQKQRTRVVWVSAVISAILGFGCYFLPGPQRMKKLSEKGYFDPTIDDLLRKEAFQMQLQGQPWFTFRSREKNEAHKKKMEAARFSAGDAGS